MTNLAHELPRPHGNQQGDDQRGEDHCDAKRFPQHAPADILEEPKDNMHVFHFAVAQGNNVFIVLHSRRFKA